MHDDLDLRVIHQRHEPDPQFVAALEQRLLAIVAGSESAAVSTDEAPVVEPEPVRRRGRRAFWIGGTATVAAAALIAGAFLLADDDPTQRVETTPAGPGTTAAQEIAPPTGRNGWVAYAQEDARDDIDVYLVRDGVSPRRVAGSDTDSSTQICPAFSPDGRRLVYGQATGTYPGGFADDPELVVVEVGADGSSSGTATIPLVGFRPAVISLEDPFDEPAPPCPVWSPDGRWVSFGGGNEVWLVDTVTEELRRLHFSSTDLDWRPGTDELAIATNGMVNIYSVTTGELRGLGGEGAYQLAWSPDGQTIAVARGTRVGTGDAAYDSTRISLVNADGTMERPLTTDYRVLHGAGPVWSPDGRSIVYQRSVGSGEDHDVVLVAADETDPETPIGTEVVIPLDRGDRPPPTSGPSLEWAPWSVTWSPDGSMLLVNAWKWGDGEAVLAVPVDTTQAVVVLAETDVAVKDGQPWLPIQSWGHQPPG